MADSVPSTVDSAPSMADSAPSLADSTPSMGDSAPSMANSTPSMTNSVPPTADSVPPTADSVPSTADSVPPTADSVPSLDLRSMNSFDRQLIDEYAVKGEKNLVFEFSMLTTLLDRHEYELVVYCFEQGNFTLTYRMKPLLIATGNLLCYQYMVSRGLTINRDILTHVIVLGNIVTLDWIINLVGVGKWPALKEFVDRNIFSLAMENGHLHIMQAYPLRYHPNSADQTHMVNCAISMGHLEIVQWLFQQYPDARYSYHTIVDALTNKHFQVLKWLTSKQGENIFRLELLIKRNGLPILKHMRKHGIPFKIQKAFRWAHQYEREEILEWLYDLECEFE